MLTPGFVTDAVGVLLILPLTRPLARRAAGTRWWPRRLLVRGHDAGAPHDVRRPGPAGQGPVIRGEVVDDD